MGLEKKFFLCLAVFFKSHPRLWEGGGVPAGGWEKESSFLFPLQKISVEDKIRSLADFLFFYMVINFFITQWQKKPKFQTASALNSPGWFR